MAGDSQGFGFGLQLLGVLVALGNALMSETSGEIARELFELRGEPFRQLGAQGFGGGGVGRPRMLICLVLKLFNRLSRFVGDFGASRGKFLLPLFE